MPRRADALSAGHTACHLASLALNRALADRWSKPARDDALGSPDFDGAAIASSRIVPDGSVDRYRLNKSLRRAGFDTASLQGDLEALGDAVAAQLDEWVATGATVRVERDGDADSPIGARWVCELPDGTARIPCGGTHLAIARPSSPRSSRRSRSRDDAGTPVLEMANEARHPTLTAECRRHPPAGLR